MTDAVEGLTGADKCADIQEKLGKACALIVGISPCGSFRMTSADVRGVNLKTWKDITPCVGTMYLSYLKKGGNMQWLKYEDQPWISYPEAIKIMEAIAAQLVNKFGIKKGDKVGIAMRNYPEFILAFLGITYFGGVAVPLNSLWKADELEYAVKDSGLKVLIGDQERLELAKPFLSNFDVKTVLVQADAAKAQELGADAVWADMVEEGKKSPPPTYKDVDFEDESMIMYTSGSTGFPKGVVHTQRSLGASIKLGELATTIIKSEPNAKLLLSIPMFHITALTQVLFTMAGSQSCVFMRKWDAGEALKIIAESKITRFTGVPTMVRDMLEHPDFSAEKFASMKNIAAGGAPVPKGQVSKMRQKSKGTASAQGYGLTETMGGVIVNSGVDYLKNPGSCGKAIPLVVSAVIKDPTGKVLKEGERGELCIKSHFNMKCYHNRPEDTEKVIDAEGYFHTGDVAKIVGGFVTILDRLKDIIIRGGENIDCFEVESALYKHPAVRECSVFGLPDERLGEVVGVAVWPQAEVTAEDLSKHAATILAKFKVPEVQHIHIVDEELPKGATGKIDKKGLRAKYSQKA